MVFWYDHPIFLLQTIIKSGLAIMYIRNLKAWVANTCLSTFPCIKKYKNIKKKYKKNKKKQFKEILVGNKN